MRANALLGIQTRYHPKANLLTVVVETSAWTHPKPRCVGIINCDRSFFCEQRSGNVKNSQESPAAADNVT